MTRCLEMRWPFATIRKLRKSWVHAPSPFSRSLSSTGLYYLIHFSFVPGLESLVDQLSKVSQCPTCSATGKRSISSSLLLNQVHAQHFERCRGGLLRKCEPLPGSGSVDRRASARFHRILQAARPAKKNIHDSNFLLGAHWPLHRPSGQEAWALRRCIAL